MPTIFFLLSRKFSGRVVTVIPCVQLNVLQRNSIYLTLTYLFVN